MPAHAITQEDLRSRIKEMEERIKQLDRREKLMEELKTWLDKRGLTPLDVLAVYRMMRPKRADAPVKSRKPLKPRGALYVSEGTRLRGDPRNIKYRSPDGRFVWSGKSHAPDWFTEHLKRGGKKEDLLIKK